MKSNHKKVAAIASKKAFELFPIKNVKPYGKVARFDMNSKMRNAYRLGYLDCYSDIQSKSKS